jgi:hypothetical protein
MSAAPIPKFTIFKPAGAKVWWVATVLPTGTKKEAELGTKHKDAANEIAKVKVRQWHSVSKAGQARWKGQRRKDGSAIKFRGPKLAPTPAPDAAAEETKQKALALIGQWSHPPNEERPTPPTPRPVVQPPPASTPPPPPPPPPSSPPPPPARDADWAADVGAAAGGAPKTDAEPSPAESEEMRNMVRMMLEQMCHGLVEGQLYLQAWLIKRRTGKEAPIPLDVPIVHPLTGQQIPSFRSLAAKCWAMQIEKWFPDLVLPEWAFALLLTGFYMPWQFAKAEKKPDEAAKVDDLGARSAAAPEDVRRAA